jgi:hypothetical protein
MLTASSTRSDLVSMSRCLLLLLLLVSTVHSNAQDNAEAEAQKARDLLRAPSDKTSLQLLTNNTKVIGGASNHRNVVATGTFDYSRDTKKFRLIETAEGNRHMTFKWRYMGRDFTETLVSIRDPEGDGPDTWREVTKAMTAKDGSKTQKRIRLHAVRGSRIFCDITYGKLLSGGLTYEEHRPQGGDYAEVTSGHFKSVPLFLHPFFREDKLAVGYHYQGTYAVIKRPTYIVGHGANYYYVDKERFLLLQWGTRDHFCGQIMYRDYRSTKFKGWGNPAQLFPSEIAVLAEGTTLGTYTVDSLIINEDLDASLFMPPAYGSPTLK